MTNIENGQHIIIEGCYLPPEHIQDFDSKCLDQIIALYIGFSNNYLEKCFTSGIIEHRSEIEQKDFDADYMNSDNFFKLHNQLKKRCKEYNVEFFEINNNYLGEISDVYKWIDEQVKTKR